MSHNTNDHKIINFIFENHLCGTSLGKNHKISLKAHSYVCAHGVGTPIARPFYGFFQLRLRIPMASNPCIRGHR